MHVHVHVHCICTIHAYEMLCTVSHCSLRRILGGDWGTCVVRGEVQKVWEHRCPAHSRRGEEEGESGEVWEHHCPSHSQRGEEEGENGEEGGEVWGSGTEKLT